MEKINVFIGSDHAGFDFKESLKEFLLELEINLVDKGTYSNESTDYPEYAHDVANSVEKDRNSLGILICGSANGVCMTANKHEDIRAAIAWTPEISKLAREHNNANIVCLPARFIDLEEGKNIISAFFGANFEGGRHQRRVEKIRIC